MPRGMGKFLVLLLLLLLLLLLTGRAGLLIFDEMLVLPSWQETIQIAGLRRSYHECGYH